MNEQQVSELLKAMAAQTKAINDQAAAINRLAESNESLSAVLYQSYADEVQDELPASTYLSGKPRG
ncbi:hypothetical protein [Pantoea endophytica]|uniref:hypothetical protein n=1 Tax=Pantoea endophytica TaxID=92488 RepID=UPI002413BFB1|nr:hypothetical protein [Pantoea endophytica]